MEKYRMENLNKVQFADDERRREELEAKGFKVVSIYGKKVDAVKETENREK